MWIGKNVKGTRDSYNALIMVKAWHEILTNNAQRNYLKAVLYKIVRLLLKYNPTLPN